MRLVKTSWIYDLVADPGDPPRLRASFAFSGSVVYARARGDATADA
jgi:hypothetical protein